MSNNIRLLNSKTLTKLLDKDFRTRYLEKISTSVDQKYGISSYAKYVVDSQILSRAKEFENDKSAYYGFQPIGIVCAVKDNFIDKRFIEFNTINHFLKLHQGEAAIDVVKCILYIWLNEDKNICSFDYEKIDAELAKLEKEYVKDNKKEEVKANEDDNRN